MSKHNGGPPLQDDRITELTSELLKTMAEAFHEDHCPDTILPVPIELVAEVKIGLQIVTVQGMIRLRVYGYLSRDRTTIYVDESTQENDSAQYRMTLAHELAHYCLHKHFYDSTGFESREQWLEFIQSISDEDHRRAEWQAETWAKFVLVPSHTLADMFRLVRSRRIGRMGAGHESSEQERNAIIDDLAKTFDVPRDVIEDRLRQDGLWHTP